MIRVYATLGLSVLMITLAGCSSMNKQPMMRGTTITPATLQPGESAVITVDMTDRHDIVDRVVAVVKEDPRVKLNLRDDGIPPDTEADDDVWTLQVDVPFQAPPGAFTLLVTAYRSDGEVIVVHDREQGDVPLSSVANVEIRYPEDATPQAAAPASPVPPPAPEAAAPPAEAAPAQP